VWLSVGFICAVFKLGYESVLKVKRALLFCLFWCCARVGNKHITD